MAEIQCPHCQKELTETQLKRLWAEYCGSRQSEKKIAAAKRNGAQGGRPMAYFQTLYDAIPDGIAALNDKLRKENARYRFRVGRVDTPDPTKAGFDVTCQDITWHCFWDGASDFIGISEDGKRRAGISRINYAAGRAAAKLVQDIHREQLMRMPEDLSDVARWIEKRKMES
jgi:hypothetical protein